MGYAADYALHRPKSAPQADTRTTTTTASAAAARTSPLLRARHRTLSLSRSEDRSKLRVCEDSRSPFRTRASRRSPRSSRASMPVRTAARRPETSLLSSAAGSACRRFSVSWPSQRRAESRHRGLTIRWRSTGPKELSPVGLGLALPREVAQPGLPEVLEEAGRLPLLQRGLPRQEEDEVVPAEASEDQAVPGLREEPVLLPRQPPQEYAG